MKTTKEQREWLRTQTNWGEHPTVRDLLDDLDEAEARAALGAQVVEAARARLECWTRETYDALVGSLRLYDAAVAETANKTSERDGREGGCAVAPLPDVQLHPSRPAEAPIRAGHLYECVHCGALFPKQPRCPKCGA